MFKKLTKNEGFSLVELLIYIGIIGVVSGMLVGILSTVTKTQVQESAQNEVTDQLNFVMSTVQRLVRDSSMIQMDSGVATSTLQLRMSALANDPTLVYLSNGQVYVQQGTGAAQSITSDKVNVDSLQFKKLSQPPGRDIVQVDLSVSEVQPAAGQTISRALRSAFSRVNAATFDYDLIPGTDNKWSVGANPSTRWLNGAFSGNVSVATGLSVGTTTSPSPNGVAYIVGNVGINSAPTSNVFLNAVGNYTGNSASYYGGQIGLTLSPTADVAVSQAGIIGSIWVNSGTTANITGALYGIKYLFGNQGSGTVSNGTAIYANLRNYGPGTVTSATGIYTDLSTNNATIGNTYGVYIGNVTMGTQTNKPFGLFQSDSNAYNYFAGNVGIGTTTPQVNLDVRGLLANKPMIFVGGNDTQTLASLQTGQNITDNPSVGIGARVVLIDKGTGGQRWDMTTGILPGKLAFRYNNTSNTMVLTSTNVGIGTDTPTTAGLVVATNVSGASIDAGSNRIINVATPTGSADAANKAYVDAAVGGGSLSVYQSDGTTLVGKYVGYYPTSTSTSNLACDNVMYTNPSTNLLSIIGYHGSSNNFGDCTGSPTAVTWYYSSSNCTGSALVTTGFSCPSSGNYYNYNQDGLATGSCSTNFGYNSYRNASTGVCTVASGTLSNYSAYMTIYTRTCGITGQCQIK